MTFTVAFLLLFAGIMIGYHLPGPVARLKAFWRRRTARPTLLQPYQPGMPASDGGLSTERKT